MRKVLDKLFAVLLLVFFAAGTVGTLIHTTVAMALDPPLWPASWIIGLQSLWQDGSYELVITWGLTWFYELAPFAVVGVLYKGTARLVDAVRRPRPEDSSVRWEAIVRRSRSRGAAWGAFMLVAAGLFLGLVLRMPQSFSRAWMLTLLPLMASPFAIVGGLVLLFDGAVPPDTHVGAIESREIIPGKNGPSRRITVAGKNFDLSASLYDQTAEGAWFRVESAAVSGRILTLSRRQMGYRT